MLLAHPANAIGYFGYGIAAIGIYELGKTPPSIRMAILRWLMVDSRKRRFSRVQK
jgi:hypothetical protein